MYSSAIIQRFYHIELWLVGYQILLTVGTCGLSQFHWCSHSHTPTSTENSASLLVFGVVQSSSCFNAGWFLYSSFWSFSLSIRILSLLLLNRDHGGTAACLYYRVGKLVSYLQILTGIGVSVPNKKCLSLI